MNRRNIIFALPCLMLAACTNNQFDPQKAVDGIKSACAIAVPASTVLKIFNLDPTMSISAIVGLVCDSFKAQQAKLGAPLKDGDKVTFVVEVNGKQVPVEATVQR